MSGEAARLRRLQEVIAKATAASTEAELARVVVDEGVAALDGSIGAMWLATEQGTLELLHWIGVEPGRRFRRVHLGGDSPLALAVRTATPVWIASRAEYAAAFPQSEQGAREGDPPAEIACACLPLVAETQAIGGLMLAFRYEREFTDDERSFLVAIARQCAHALAHLRARREAETASRIKDEFLALLGHELRNPLAPIVSALSLMKLRPGAAAVERERDIIERQVLHLTRLVDDLLDVSRITRGTVALEREPIELASAIAQALETSTPLMIERGHKLSVEVPEGIVLDADARRLVQVISNLLVNAGKYTPDRGLITVEASADATMACVRISDNGIGIAPSLLPRVFDMFVQGERASDRAEGGLGLGLAVVKSMVERHGGRVTAASDGPGKGAVFTIWWPRAASGPAIAKPVPREERKRSLRVLVVDDNLDAAYTLGELLKVLGHDPLVAHDAPSALALARDEPPEVALVDLGLPVLDGYELAARLHAIPGLAALPVIAVTGYGSTSDRMRTQKAGFADHLVKPVALETLRTRLAAL